MSVFFVYLDWTLEDSPRIFYVGKGQLRRVKRQRRNLYWQNIAAKFGWRREIAYATKDEAHAFEVEKRWIAEFGTFEDGEPNKWGANLTLGGEGIAGRKGPLSHLYQVPLTEAQKENLRLKNTGPNNPNWGVKGLDHWLTGKPGANLGKTFSPEWRAKLAAKKRGARNPNVVINYATATEIRRLYSCGGWTHRSLAAHFGVGPTVIFQVLNNITWKVEHNS